MYLPPNRPRPGLLTLIGVVSLIWSATTLLGALLAAVIFVLIGAGSWMGGPMVGSIGTALVGLILVWVLACSALSIVLFVAGWKTLKDDPDGIRLHRLWAWISIGLDVVGLLASGGIAANSWAGLIYAGAVLYITSLPEVVSYYDRRPFAPLAKPGGWSDDLV